MATRTSSDLLIQKKWSEYQHHNQRAAKIMKSTEITNKNPVEPKSKVFDHNKVPVVYYLSRNGQLEHPHFVQVPLSSPQGLHLRDVINLLNYLRGEGMGYMYSWSAKRSYNNGYVWQDLSEDDLIHPTNGHDYVLKGSELLHTSTTEATLFGGSNRDAFSAMAAARRKNQSWSTFENPEELNEYIVLKCESSRDLARKFSLEADVGTQTEEKRGHCGGTAEKIVEELSRDELSPPPSMSSSAGSEGRGNVHEPTAGNECDSIGKMKASKVWMQLVTCGSFIPFQVLWKYEKQG
ncbi:hypothetical protein LIER_09660 [Lithospermum erythrorhizon]|uniref:SOSEKI DIX-like domain-containing protein n=1 Tax=Lithospermum erythrorhizon TaxID=34254 RepID=A0AAV3PGN1_LITER